MSAIAEVEIQRTGIEMHFRGQDLQAVEIDDRFEASRLAGLLRGQRLQSVIRRGKLLGLEFEWDFLAVHFGITGYFSLEKHPRPSACFLFDQPLYFYDSGKSATITPTSIWSKIILGPDLWRIVPGWRPELKYLYSRRAIKNTLLDQNVVAGIGNYLANEALWAAGISPFRKTKDIDDDRWEEIVSHSGRISRESMRRGGVWPGIDINIIGDKVTGQQMLQVHGKGGQSCSACGGKIAKEDLSGRATFWCPDCQN